MTSSRAAASVALAVAFLLGGFGCGDDPREFGVVEVMPRPSDGPLALNRPVTIVFNSEIDPSSVTRLAVAVKDAAGEPAPGRLEPAGDRVTFVPRPVSASDLEDGGYAPDSEVKIELRGFPGRDGVLGKDGAPLATPLRVSFRTAAVDGGDAGYGAFFDPVPGVGPRLLNVDVLSDPDGAAVHPQGVVRLLFSEPLAPRSVGPGSVALRYDNRDRDPVATEVELIQGERGAELRVRPRDGFREGTRYLLVLEPGGLRDLVGTPLDDVHPIHLVAEEHGPRVAGAAPAEPAH